MEKLLDIIIVLILALLTWQDFKMRRISVAAIILLAFVTVLRRLCVISIKELEQQFLWNMAFIALQLLLLTLYWMMRRKKVKDLFSQGIGLGDILFFIIMCIAFPAFGFILYFTAGLALSLVGYASYLLLNSNKSKDTPLAGLLSFFWILLILVSYTFNFKYCS